MVKGEEAAEAAPASAHSEAALKRKLKKERARLAAADGSSANGESAKDTDTKQPELEQEAENEVRCMAPCHGRLSVDSSLPCSCTCCSMNVDVLAQAPVELVDPNQAKKKLASSLAQKKPIKKMVNPAIAKAAAEEAKKRAKKVRKRIPRWRRLVDAVAASRWPRVAASRLLCSVVNNCHGMPRHACWVHVSTYHRWKATHCIQGLLVGCHPVPMPHGHFTSPWLPACHPVRAHSEDHGMHISMQTIDSGNDRSFRRPHRKKRTARSTTTRSGAKRRKCERRGQLFWRVLNGSKCSVMAVFSTQPDGVVL
jgi:hypothetical protein